MCTFQPRVRRCSNAKVADQESQSFQDRKLRPTARSRCAQKKTQTQRIQRTRRTTCELSDQSLLRVWDSAALAVVAERGNAAIVRSCISIGDLPKYTKQMDAKHTKKKIPRKKRTVRVPAVHHPRLSIPPTLSTFCCISEKVIKDACRTGC